MTDWDELRWQAEENLREAFRTMARYSADGAVLEVDHACHVATGVPNAFFNPVFLYRAPDDLENFLRRVQAFYEARGGLPWSLVVMQYEDNLPLLSSDRIRDAGLCAAGSIPLVVRNTQRDTGWPRTHSHFSIQRVEDYEALGEHRETLAQAFGLPGYVADMLFGESPPPTMRPYIAYYQGEPVGTAALLTAAGVGGLYNIGVTPAMRNRGVGTALVRHVLDEACWECGLSECIAQVPRPALTLFRQLGFDRLGICARYTEPQHLPPEEGKRRS
jgi:GNAT superfamily N-acetyltransferase